MASKGFQSVARRYARALFDLAQEQNLVDQVERELDLVLHAAAGSKELQMLLELRTISAEVKHAALDKAFGGKLSTLTLNFLHVLIAKRREAILADVKNEFVALANQARGIIEVEVRSARPLDSDVLAALQNKLAARFGKQVQMHTRVEPELIGGLVVRVGDQLLDGSVKTRLQRLKSRLVAAQAE
jgi:F-type H+-transporting ATPase subunit delta